MDKTRRDEQEAWEHAEDVKRNIHRLSLSRRFYLHAAEIKLKRNRATIAAARLRNRQLRSALNDLREKERCALGVNDLARVQKRVAALGKYHNHLLHMSKVRHKLLLERQTDTEMAKIDCDDVLDQNTPPLRKHCTLASVVKKGRSELQRAHAKDLTYQEKLKPMLDDRTIFDAQVDTLARTVAKKHHEFDELIFMYHDACRTREAARGQLQQSENEHLKRILVHLEQKLVQILQGLQGWMEGMREEKAKEHYARLHRTSMMIKENYDKRHGASHEEDNASTPSTYGQD